MKKTSLRSGCRRGRSSNRIGRPTTRSSDSAPSFREGTFRLPAPLHLCQKFGTLGGMTTPQNAQRLRLVLYVRVSTGGQLDGYGLEAQEADGRKWARKYGHRIV